MLRRRARSSCNAAGAKRPKKKLGLRHPRSGQRFALAGDTTRNLAQARSGCGSWRLRGKTRVPFKPCRGVSGFPRTCSFAKLQPAHRPSQQEAAFLFHVSCGGRTASKDQDKFLRSHAQQTGAKMLSLGSSMDGNAGARVFMHVAT